MSSSLFSKIALVYYWDIPSRNADVVYTIRMCEAMQKLGYPTTLFAHGDPQTNLDMIWEAFNIQDKFDIRLYPTKKLFRKYDAALRVSRALSAMKDTLVWGRHTPAVLAAALMKMPVILEAHTPPGDRMGKYYARWVISQPSFKGLVVITPFVKAAYLKQYKGLLSPEQILIEPNAVIMEHYDALPEQSTLRETLGLPLDKPIIGYCGSLYEGRGIDIILQMAKRLPDINFMIVGGEEHHIAFWKDKIRDARLNNVLMVGFVPSVKIPQYIKSADILLSPHQSIVRVDDANVINQVEYTSPMKLFEYMASQRPIIASDLPILHEVLNDQNARFCLPEDVAEWVSAIEYLLSNPTIAQQLAQQAYRDVQPHTWEKRAQRALTTFS